MIGTLGGITLALTYIGLSAEHGWTISALALGVSALAVFMAGVLLGLILRLTVGFVAMWGMFGAAIGAVIEFVYGNPAYGLALLAHALSLWCIGQALAFLTWGPPQRSPFPQPQYFRINRIFSRRKVWATAPATLDWRIPLAPELGSLTWYDDDTYVFSREWDGKRTRFDKIDLLSWQRRTITVFTHRHHKIRLRGAVGLLEADIDVTPQEDAEAWMDRLRALENVLEDPPWESGDPSATP